MVYEAVPDDVEITKLTVGQRDALSRHRRHENINTILANENTPLLIGGVALLAALPILHNLFVQTLEEQNILLTDKQKELLKQGYKVNLLVSPLGPFILGREAAKALVDLDLKDIEKKLSGLGTLGGLA